MVVIEVRLQLGAELVVSLQLLNTATAPKW